MIVFVGYLSLTDFMKLVKCSVYPLATSLHINLKKLNYFNTLSKVRISSF